MPIHIAYREYQDNIANCVQEEIIFAESPEGLKSRLYDDKEIAYEQRDFTEIPVERHILSLVLMAPQFGLFYAQGGGLSSLNPSPHYQKGSAKKAYDAIVDGLGKSLKGEDPGFPRFE